MSIYFVYKLIGNENVYIYLQIRCSNHHSQLQCDELLSKSQTNLLGLLLHGNCISVDIFNTVFLSVKLNMLALS